MQYRQAGQKWFIRIDRGEEVLEVLAAFCREHGINLGSISGIGAAGEIKLGLFETASKTYQSTEFKGDFEITALAGNVTTKEGEIYLHVHATLSDKDCRAYGGHLNRALISGTCEVVIDQAQGSIDRLFDQDVGLNLMKFD
ncbi:PPC domain-containing DNA-binding protein [Desulfonatronospira sp.]|uniref:PPC domain-containing DNA-binding protein n=1 Tax=Desulfonatronospira sp. TaxID=1962951 RepID=UPI0025BF7495|nr:PPC domain-containing DNA-binding protein [Desulfonatronospira sp.]